MEETLVYLNTSCPRCGSTLFYETKHGEIYCAGKMLSPVDQTPSLCGYTIKYAPPRKLGGRYPKAYKCKVCGDTPAYKSAYCEKHRRMKALQSYRMRKQLKIKDK